MTGGRTETARHLSWFVTATLLLVGCEGGPTAPTPVEEALPPGTVDTVPPQDRPAYHPVAIRCVATVVAPGRVVDCEADPSDNTRWRFVWTVEPRAGVFLSGHYGPRFRWQAPQTPGRYLLRLRVEPRTEGYAQPVDLSRPLYVQARAPAPAPDDPGPTPAPVPASLRLGVAPAVVDGARAPVTLLGGQAPYQLTASAGGWCTQTDTPPCTGGRGLTPTTTVRDDASLHWVASGTEPGATAVLTVTDAAGQRDQVTVTVR